MAGVSICKAHNQRQAKVKRRKSQKGLTEVKRGLKSFEKEINHISSADL
jgi:hypothetical protein